MQLNVWLLFQFALSIELYFEQHSKRLNNHTDLMAPDAGQACAELTSEAILKF